VKIVFVSAQVIQGGAECRLARLLGGLDRDTIERLVFLAEGPFVDEMRREGYPVEVLPTSARAPSVVRTAFGVRRLLRRAGPDVVHADGVKAGLVAVLATALGGPPVLWVKNDFSWDGPLVRLIGSRSRRIVVVSAAVGAALGSRARSRMRVVHSGLPELSADAEAGRRRLEEAFGSPAVRVVTLVGRLDPIKGHRELLAVARQLRERVPDVRIAFIGPADPSHPEEERLLRREIAELGLEDVVGFLGFQEPPALYDLVAASEVVAVVTVAQGGRGMEGLGNAGLEAMALGTPVVGYGQGGVPELLGDCGLLVAPGDREGLGLALVRVLTDEQLRAQLSACGRDRVAKEFSVARMIEAMRACYAELS
jgi:glycosyltransferase involved in cell wall biosynthesis